MGAKMLKYYELVEQAGGLPLKMRLAMKTGVPANKAQETPDTAANLAKFEAALREILGPNAPKL